MNHIKLLTIENCFQITGQGVVIIPDFSVPRGWKNRTETVVVIKPDGHQYETIAKFTMTHFNISDPTVSIDKHWRVTICFPDRKKEELPAGSNVFVSQEIREMILPNSDA